MRDTILAIVFLLLLLSNCPCRAQVVLKEVNSVRRLNDSAIVVTSIYTRIDTVVLKYNHTYPVDTSFSKFILPGKNGDLDTLVFDRFRKYSNRIPPPKYIYD